MPADGGPSIELFGEPREPGDVTTRDVFQVSPDGAYLAYVSDTLHVRSAKGDERALAEHDVRQIRFSPDGTHLVAVTGDRDGRPFQRVTAMDVATGKTRVLATDVEIRQLEWVYHGVIAVERQRGPDRHKLVYLPLEGTGFDAMQVPTSLYTTRIVAARDGTRVVAFFIDSDAHKVRIVAFDLAAPQEQHQLATIDDTDIINVDASFDGSRVAYTTPRGLFVIDGDAKPQLVSERTDIHSLWFARDGRLAYASPKLATVLDGRRAVQLETGSEIRMLRFDTTSSQVLVASDREVREWDPATKRSRRLVDMATYGADRFAGGLVVWTAL